MKAQDLRSEITSQLIEALRSGARPWVSPWTADLNCGSPKNVVSKTGYRGINPLILELSADRSGYLSRWWGTYKQWRELGGQVRKGEKGTRVIYYRPIETKEINPATGKPDTFPLMRSFVLFNVDQVDGDFVHLYPSLIDMADPEAVDWQPAGELLNACNANEQFGGNKAFYRPSDDSIHIPSQAQFRSLRDFYATRFHEYGHWACDSRRLGLALPVGTDGKAAYAYEELVVEIASCYLAAELNLPASDDTANHEAYLASWLRALENDPSWILKASSAASKVVDHLLSYSGINTNVEAPV